MFCGHFSMICQEGPHYPAPNGVTHACGVAAAAMTAPCLVYDGLMPANNVDENSYLEYLDEHPGLHWKRNYDAVRRKSRHQRTHTFRRRHSPVGRDDSHFIQQQRKQRKPRDYKTLKHFWYFLPEKFSWPSMPKETMLSW